MGMAFLNGVAKFPNVRPSEQLLIEPSIRAVKHALEVRAVASVKFSESIQIETTTPSLQGWGSLQKGRAVFRREDR